MNRFINSTKTAVLLGALFALILFIGHAVGGRQGLIFAFFVGGLMNVIAFFFSGTIALKAMHAKEVDERAAPDLIAMVRRLAENAGLPMPRVYICPQEAPNAFATGRSPKHGAVAVTQGALRLLSYDELEGVMAHELAHVKNRDTLISCVAATIAGAINVLAYMAILNRDMHPLLKLAVFLIAPIAAGVIQMAISRSREYIADHDAAVIAGTPEGLIGALQKLGGMAQRIPMEGELSTQNHMFIVQPLSSDSLSKLFSTHPPMEDRIAKLMEMRR